MSAQESLGILGGLIVTVPGREKNTYTDVLMSADLSAGEMEERRPKEIFCIYFMLQLARQLSVKSGFKHVCLC